MKRPGTTGRLRSAEEPGGQRAGAFGAGSSRCVFMKNPPFRWIRGGRGRGDPGSMGNSDAVASPALSERGASESGETHCITTKVGSASENRIVRMPRCSID